MQEIGTFVFELDNSVRQVKYYLSEQLNKLHHLSLDPEYILFRENVFDKPAKVLFFYF